MIECDSRSKFRLRLLEISPLHFLNHLNLTLQQSHQAQPPLRITHRFILPLQRRRPHIIRPIPLISPPPLLSNVSRASNNASSDLFNPHARNCVDSIILSRRLTMDLLVVNGMSSPRPSAVISSSFQRCFSAASAPLKATWIVRGALGMWLRIRTMLGMDSPWLRVHLYGELGKDGWVEILGEI
jgi:hypothetical protein